MPRIYFPSAIRRILATLAFHLGATGMLATAGVTPPAPASLVLDDARLFDAAVAGQMSRALTELQQSTGVSVYVATSSYQDSAVISNLAQHLVEQWLAGKAGAVITYNRGNSQPGVVASPDLWRRYSADGTAQMLTDTARALTLPDTSPEERIPHAVQSIVDRIRRLDADRNPQPALFATAERKLAAWLAAIIILSSLTLWLISLVRRKTE